MNTLAGTGSLVRLALRRDRILLPAWIAVFVGMVYSSAAATVDLYPTLASRVKAVDSLDAVPVLVALYGRVYSSSLGALSLLKMGGIGTAFLAVLAFMLVVRHTRAEEEADRLELLGATVVGRAAPLTAGLAIGAGASVVIGVLSGLSLMSAGLPASGSLAFGLSWAAIGCAFASVGAFTAQLTTGGRAASGIAAAFLGLAYMVRAVGDAAGHDDASWFSWLSPIGWSQQVRPFAHERWPVLLLLVVFAVAVAFGAYALARRRDLGAGLLADRPGPAVASARLSGPLGLAWRLQRGTVLAWTLSIVLAGAIVGSIASQIGGMLDTPAAKDFIMKLGGTRMLIDAYLALELGMLGSIVAVLGMQAAMRLRSEEAAWRADLMLSTATGRTRWLASHAAIALGGTAAILLLGGLASAIGNAVAVGDAGEIERVFLGAVVQIPAAFVMVGIVVAAFGLVPRLMTATWALFVAFLLLGEFGTLFEFPRWVMDISPFAHTPRLPGGTMEAAPLVGSLAVAVLLMAAGILGFRRRDVSSSS